MQSAIVVGAGVFGSSLAHRLAGSGWDVTLVEQYSPGHVRAASGGENRLIRASHGADEWYTASAKRALELWRELEQESGAALFVPCGVVWFFDGSGDWAAESERVLTQHGLPAERLEPGEAARLFPSFDPAGLTTVLLEPAAGVLRARDATRALAEQAVARGVRIVHGRAAPENGSVSVGGERLEADRVVWAGGAWLAGLFPGLVELKVTRQEVFFFGVPPDWQSPGVPAWVDFDGGIYGVGDVDGRGFKASPDEHGPEFDPDSDDRVVSVEKEQAARAYLAMRFPALASAPLVGSRACPYSLTPDLQFLVARHPVDDRVWLVGGGSGHGFKHGPALAEYVERLLTGQEEPQPRFGLGPRGPGGGLRTAGTS
jgi:sarcosine oxidase